jgi:hypothetical protein
MSDSQQLSNFHIAFDTNLPFTESESKLINKPLTDFIREWAASTHPRITWYLPDIFRNERAHQMALAASKLLVQVDKVSKLLDRDFGITRTGLEQAIDGVIAREIEQLRLVLLKLDTSAVDWDALINRATRRDPPFEEGPREKGFRDSLILETFDQLVKRISASKSYQRVVLITKDGAMKEAFDRRMAGRDNVLRVDDIESLKSILNAYASDMAEDTLHALLKRAQAAFVSIDGTEGLFYKWTIERIIRQDHGGELFGIQQITNQGC